MRLSEEKIKLGLHHTDAEVRTSVAEYFGNSFLPDASIMPQVMEAIAKYDLDAFTFYMFLEEMIKTDGAMEWAIEKIQHVDLLGSWHENDFGDSLGQAIVFADDAVLIRHAATLEELENLDELVQESIGWRVNLSKSDADALWQEFNDYCDQCEEEDDPYPELVERDRLLFASMKRFPDQLHERVLALLKDDTSKYRRSLAIRLVAELRLADAVPHLLNFLNEAEGEAFDEVIRSLATLDQEVAVKEISVRFHGVEGESRKGLAVFLRLIHTDQSVQTCLQLLDEEKEDVVRAKLLQAVLMNFSTAGIEPARQFLLEAPKSSSVLDLRDALFIACKLMGETFPEFDEWQEDRKGDADLRQKWNEEDDPYLLDLGEFNKEEEELDEELDEFYADALSHVRDDEEEQPAIPSVTVVNEQPHVGRNDPCPCGSGKKFKKCCYRKVSDSN